MLAFGNVSDQNEVRLGKTGNFMTDKHPKITVVTPSYNQGRYIEQTIRSVLEQDYPNLEYIIIDGGSTDQSVEIIQRYADRLTYWISEADGGQTEALNKGMRRATGDILCYLNSDDVFLPGALAAVARAFAAGGDWWSGWCIRFGGVRDGIGFSHNYKSLMGLTRYCGIYQQATFWSRRAYEKTGEFNAKMHYSFDYEYWLRLFIAGYRLKEIRQPLAAFRYHQEAKTANPQKFYDEDEKMLSRILPQTAGVQRILAMIGMRRRRAARAMAVNLLQTVWRFPEVVLTKGFYMQIAQKKRQAL
jgi:glycosyltransferase involved in cell wall biosynthesis